MREEELWLVQAEHDLEAAEYNLGGGFLDQCLVCCQQATEKALKALYIARHRQAPPRSHDIERLARMVGLEQALPPELTGLTEWYMEARYPDMADAPAYQKVTSDIAEAALRETRTFLTETRDRLHG